MAMANWARKKKRLLRNAEELKSLGCVVIFPPDFHLPPERRTSVSSLPLE
jgi:hypothetical protein